jgi:cytochrome P450
VPGPKGPGWRNVVHAYREGVLQFLTRQTELYGGFVCLRHGRTYIAAAPECVKHVLQDRHLNYVKGPRFRRMLGPLIGRGLLSADGEDWRRLRYRTQPYFLRKGHSSYVESVAPAVAEVCDRFAAHADEGKPVNLNQEMDRLAVAANLWMMCGADAVGDVDALVAAFVETGHSLDPVAGFNPLPLPEFIPTPRRIRFQRAVAAADRIIHRLVTERRRRGPATDDLLGGLIFNRENEPDGDSLLRDEIMTMLHAGFETVSDQLVWNFLSLAQHPEHEARVRDESVQVLGGRIPAFEELHRLPHLYMVMQEVMRLYPAAWGYFRTALEDDVIQGYPMPAGSLVIISPYLTHRLRSVWADPEQFQPERFQPDRAAGRHKFAFFPFGAGPRHCIGGEVAMLLIAMTIASLLQRFAIEPQAGQQVRPVPRISLKPEPSLWVRIHRRR